MHMSDALLSPAVGGAMYAVSAVSIAYAVQKVKKDDLGEKNLPMMAVAGAFTFAAQMINFTIPGMGSSGHIGGGILLAGLLGGTPAVVTLTAVLLIQCLFFADGGLLALGANIFNMGVIPCLFVCPLIFRPILRKGVTHKRIMIASVVSCVVGLQLGAFCVDTGIRRDRATISYICTADAANSSGDWLCGRHYYSRYSEFCIPDASGDSDRCIGKIGETSRENKIHRRF